MITKLRARIIEVYGCSPQNHLADNLRINRARMSQYATGSRAIPTHHLVLLCEALSCGPAEIVGFTELEEV